MPESGSGLTRKLGPLPVWGWGLVAGGTIGAVLLIRRSKAPAGEAVPEHLAVPEVASAGGGAPGGGEGKASLPELLQALRPTEPSATTATPVSEFLQTQHELEAGGYTRAPTGSTAPATQAALSASAGGTPGRGGVSYKPGTYKGMAAHVYARAVPGGVGPGKNVIVLGGAGKKTHSAKPSHAPAHAKAKPKPAAHKPIAPTRHTTKPRRASHPAKRRAKAKKR